MEELINELANIGVELGVIQANAQQLEQDAASLQERVRALAEMINAID